jgi:Membrane-bound serine protease (ClpP class)
MLGPIEGMFILAIILFITGFILVGIEMITPGLHAPGIIGTGCLVIAIFLIADNFVEGTLITILVLGILAIMLGVILHLLSKGKLKSPIILDEEQNKDKGYTSSNNLNHLLGKEGIAITDLRPTGVGNFNGSDYDVLSEGKYISKGANLVIYKVLGSKLIVKEHSK